MPLLLQTRLLEIMDLVKKSTSVDQLMNLMKQEFPQRVSEFQLVESYINGLVNMDDKSTVRDYTKQVYAQIDASSLDVSAVSRLKTKAPLINHHFVSTNNESYKRVYILDVGLGIGFIS